MYWQHQRVNVVYHWSQILSWLTVLTQMISDDCIFVIFWQRGHFPNVYVLELHVWATLEHEDLALKAESAIEVKVIQPLFDFKLSHSPVAKKNNTILTLLRGTLVKEINVSTTYGYWGKSLLCLVTEASLSCVWWLRQVSPVSGDWGKSLLCLVTEASLSCVCNHLWWLRQVSPVSGDWAKSLLCL
jgi:hypothetical protein